MHWPHRNMCRVDLSIARIGGKPSISEWALFVFISGRCVFFPPGSNVLATYYALPPKGMAYWEWNRREYASSNLLICWPFFSPLSSMTTPFTSVESTLPFSVLLLLHSLALLPQDSMMLFPSKNNDVPLPLFRPRGLPLYRLLVP